MIIFYRYSAFSAMLNVFVRKLFEVYMLAIQLKESYYLELIMLQSFISAMDFWSFVILNWLHNF